MHTHSLTPQQTQNVPEHADSLPGFFHQLDLSQLIISSFEPWAQSMIALSINAYIIYFDGASNDKVLARVYVQISVLRIHLWACVCVYIYKDIYIIAIIIIHTLNNIIYILILIVINVKIKVLK